MCTLYLGDDFIFILSYSTFYSILFYYFIFSFILSRPSPCEACSTSPLAGSNPLSSWSSGGYGPLLFLREPFPLPGGPLGWDYNGSRQLFPWQSLQLACGKLSCIPGDSMGKGACSYYSQEGEILLCARINAICQPFF